MKISPCRTHHILQNGEPGYAHRFAEVLSYHPPGLAAVLDETGAYHIHGDGTPAYADRFDRTFGFYEGLAAVERDGVAFHITLEGQPAYPTRYLWCGNFQDGRCTVRSEQGYRHIDSRGAPAYETHYAYAGDYRDGAAVVQTRDGRHTHVDVHGRLLHGCYFDDLDVYHKGYARARDERGWMHVDTSGVPIYTRRFAAVEPFYNGKARIEALDGALHVIDESGRTIIELRPALRSEFAALSHDMVGFWRTETIGTAVALGVFEHLPGTLPMLAHSCGMTDDKALRLLRALGELGLVKEGADGWSPTLRGNYLRLYNPMTLADAAIEYLRPMADRWKKLPHLLGANSSFTEDIFSEMAPQADRLPGHHRMLRSYALHDYAEVPAALGLQGDERIIDAGGGTGTLSELLLRHYPRLSVVLLDRPEVVELARTNGLSGVEVHAVDLFGPWHLQADAVLLARILHDWDDDRSTTILRRAREAILPGGRLFIVEMVVPERGFDGSLCDLHLLAMTGGRERTAREFEALFQAAGFELKEVRRLPALPSILVGEAR